MASSGKRLARHFSMLVTSSERPPWKKMLVLLYTQFLSISAFIHAFDCMNYQQVQCQFHPMPCRATVDPPRTLFSHACVHLVHWQSLQSRWKQLMHLYHLNISDPKLCSNFPRTFGRLTDEIASSFTTEKHSHRALFQIEMLRSFLPQWSVQTGIVSQASVLHESQARLE